MKSKHIFLIVALAFIAFNTLMGGVLDAYKMATCGFVDLSIFLSAGLFYNLFASELSDGLKIGVSFLLGLTGIARTICVGIMGTDLHNNVPFLIAVFIFLMEISLLFIASYISNKK